MTPQKFEPTGARLYGGPSESKRKRREWGPHCGTAVGEEERTWVCAGTNRKVDGLVLRWEEGRRTGEKKLGIERKG